MNWKIALLWLLIFMTTRIILSYCIDWHITHETIAVAVVGSLIIGFLERNRNES